MPVTVGIVGNDSVAPSFTNEGDKCRASEKQFPRQIDQQIRLRTSSDLNDYRETTNRPAIG